VDDDDGVDEEEDVRDFGRINFSELESPYLTPYLYNMRFIDKQYGIRREEDGRFMIGDLHIVCRQQNDISIKGSHFKGTRVIWELLTPKNVTRGAVRTDDLK
jgi:hypothetical protein